MSERKKVGIALSGGGIRGLGHIGVLRVLEKFNIPVDLISGTSIGALIGALYASEPNAKKLEKEALIENIGKLLDYTLSKHGIIKGEKLESYLQKKLGNVSFQDLKIPLYITAYDIVKKREVIFHKGDVAKAVRASISIPGIFIPVENKDEILIDAGIIDPIPIKVLRDSGAEIIIAVNVDSRKERKPWMDDIAVKQRGNKKLPSILETAMLGMSVEGSEIINADIVKDKPDFVININLEDVTLFDYKKAKMTIEVGKKTAMRSLRDLKTLTEPHPFKDFLEDLGINLDFKSIVRKVKSTLKN